MKRIGWAVEFVKRDGTQYARREFARGVGGMAVVAYPRRDDAKSALARVNSFGAEAKLVPVYIGEPE